MAAFAAALDPSSVPSTKTESNRRNAQLSTGPRTPEGKETASLNALKHGLFASLKNLPPAEREVFDLIAAVIPHADSCEHLSLHRQARELALLLYRQDRIRRLEFSIYAERTRAICQAEGLPDPDGLAESGLLEARIFREDALGPRTLAKLHTQERFFTREIEKATARYYDELRAIEGKRWRSSPEYKELLAQRCAEIPALLASFPQIEDGEEPAAAEPPAQPARSAPCPCGSGLKYKRCCGLNAPPQLHPAA